MAIFNPLHHVFVAFLFFQEITKNLSREHSCNRTSGFRIYYRPHCGKVMFSQACVKNSVHRGGVHGRGACVVGGHA